MTTQELKEYIGRVLGNSIRCLLPSYWWKRLFGLVVDAMDKGQKDLANRINAISSYVQKNTVYIPEEGEVLSNWMIEQNARAVNSVKQIDDIVFVFDGGKEMRSANLIYSNGSYLRYIDGLLLKESVVYSSGNVETTVIQSLEGDSVIVDTEMSSTSENAVQNKAIKEYVDKAVQDVNITLDSALSDTSTNAVQNKAITEAMNNKVDKVEGKQLSTEDFTTALKTKLEGMSSFDPTEINNKVDGLQSQINTLVSGDASTAIESFNEIIAFLNGVQDTESLDGIIAGIEQQIAAKQDKIADLDTIRSGAALGATAIQSVKTINGESIVGDGNIEIKANVDTSTLATKEMVTSLSNEVVANEEVTAAALNDLNERINAISENVRGETATKVELQSAVESLTNTILENEEITAAALNDLNERIENAGGGGKIDTELSETSENAIANRVVTAEFNNIKEKIEGIENIVADNKVLLYLTIEGEPNNTLFEDVKATITYGDTTVVAGNETVILPTFTEVTITFPSIDGYNKPQDIVFTTGWSDTIYKTGVYSTLIPSYISIDQTITDPALMITGDVNGYEIQKIRNNSHRYLGKYTAEGTMTLCQLDDSDSTKYADGSTADLTGAEGDVFVKLPRFWYKAEEIQSDVWRIGFMCGNIAPSSEWKEWDGNDLIGAYEAYVESSKVYSRSGVSSSADIAPSTYITNGASRGKGFSLVKWHHHNMMAFLFYAMYGNTNCQAIVGSGTSVDSKPTGQTDLLGMEDTSASTNGNSQSINFWGLENWWGNKFEIVDNVTYASKTYYITEDDGVIRNVYSGLSNGSTWPKKLKIGEYLDCVPTLGGGSATTGYCDTCSPTDSGGVQYYLRRSYPREITGCGVVAFNTASSATSNGGSRLAFKGSIIEEINVDRFKLMEAIA